MTGPRFLRSNALILLLAAPLAAEEAPPAPPPASTAPPIDQPPEAAAPAPATEGAATPPPAAPAGPGPQAPPVPRAVIYEPPPPGMGPVFEPPAPLTPQHLSPENALWVGLRTGWFLPFGNIYAQALSPNAQGVVFLEPVPWQDYARSGLALEADIGVRLARNYMLFALWERAQLTTGDADEDLYGEQVGSDSDFWAGAVRATSNADRLGLVTELAIGYRQARTRFEDGSKLQLTGAAFEGRLGIGADLRMSSMLTLSPLATIGVGSFNRVRMVRPNGSSYDLPGPRDTADTHAWFTLTVAGHVDIFGSK